MEEKIKCEKCGAAMIKEDPFLHRKDEGEKVDDPSENIYRCSDPKCTGVRIVQNQEL